MNPHASSSCGGSRREKALFTAAYEGDLERLKKLVMSYDKGDGIPSALRTLQVEGFGLLHAAACQARLEVCIYLVQKLRCGVNMLADGGTTPLMAAAESGDVPTVRYFLEVGADPMKPDSKGVTALHRAVAAGCGKVTEFLLSEGVPVDIDCGLGTPLHHAASNDQDKMLKILFDHNPNLNAVSPGVGTPLMNAVVSHSWKCAKLLLKAGADVNCPGSMSTPLLFAASLGGYTDFIKLLIEAGADPNDPDDLGRFPVQLAATRNCREEVELLFPLTSPIPTVPEWTIDGLISYAKSEDSKPMDQGDKERRKTLFKSMADEAYHRRDYRLASEVYGLAIAHVPDAALYANRSLCRLLMGDGEGALSDARECRILRPNWAKACYREASALMLLKEYRKACDPLLDALSLDPKNAEFERELWRAVELMKNPPDDRFDE